MSVFAVLGGQLAQKFRAPFLTSRRPIIYRVCSTLDIDHQFYGGARSPGWRVSSAPDIRHSYLCLFTSLLVNYEGQKASGRHRSLGEALFVGLQTLCDDAHNLFPEPVMQLKRAL